MNPEDGDTTQELPQSLFPSAVVRKPPTPRVPERWRPFLFAGGSVIAVVVVVFAVLLTSAQIAPKSPLGSVFGCSSSTPCGVAQAYVNDFSSNNYEAMYSLTSTASHQRFSNRQILTGPGYSYANAHDYIVTRTSSFVQFAHITHISGSTGDVKQTSGTQATVPARIVYSSAVFGDIVEDMTIPLVSENGQWKVDWSPGLIVPQLDDPNGDPNYTRHVVASISIGKRGSIYDNCATSCAAADVLAQDASVWQVEVKAAQVQNEASLVQALSAALNLPAAQVKANYEAPWNCGPSGYRLVATLTQQPAAAVSSITGVTINQTTGRVYQYGTKLAPVTGYIAPITGDQLSADTTGYYNQCSLIGDSGVEEWGEQYLRPVQGGTLAIYGRNADGTDQSTPYYTIASKSPANGDDIHTTINLTDQLATMNAMLANHNGDGGGSFAVDPNTGAVLVLASTSNTSPACDPNAFAQGNIFAQSGCSQLDNALQAQVPTGSIFKIVTLATALENGVVTPTQQFPPATCYQIPGQPTPTCPLTNSEPACQVTLDPLNGLGRSCDIMFYMMGVELGNKDPTLLPNMARSFGFGASPGVVGIPDDEQGAGLVPDPSYYQSHGLGNWAPVNSANLAIGQDRFEATPAQVALLSAAIADNGKRMQPELVSSVTSGALVVQANTPQQIGTVPVSATNLGYVQQGMIDVVEPNGTSYDVFKGFPIQVAGKTGTAESGSGNEKPHAWFTYYAPATPPGSQPAQPKIAMSVLFVKAGFGDANAAPVCRALLVAAFNLPSGQGG